MTPQDIKSLGEQANNTEEEIHTQKVGRQIVVLSPADQGSQPSLTQKLPQKPASPISEAGQPPKLAPQVAIQRKMTRSRNQSHSVKRARTQPPASSFPQFSVNAQPVTRGAPYSTQQDLFSVRPHSATPEYRQAVPNSHVAAYNSFPPRPAYHRPPRPPIQHAAGYHRPQVAIYPGDLMYLPDIHEIITPAMDACRNAADLISYGNNLISQGLGGINRGTMMINQQMHNMNLVVHTVHELEMLIRDGHGLVSQGHWYIRQAQVLNNQIVENVTHAFRLGQDGYPEEYLSRGQERVPITGHVQPAVASMEQGLEPGPPYHTY